jgi:phosphoglycolate phosphatase
MKKLRLAVFDCDGTLVDSQQSIVKTMAAAFAAHSHEQPAAQDVRRIIGLQLDQAIGVLLPEVAESQVRQITQSYKDIFYNYRLAGAVNEPLYPNVEVMFDTLLSDGWLLGIATGKSMRGLKATLKTYGFLKYFVTLQTADVALGKPNPDMLLRAMAQTGAEPADTFMIGDTTFDMNMANNAKTKGIGVSWGYHTPEELHDCGACTVIDEFTMLPRVLDDLTACGG